MYAVRGICIRRQVATAKPVFPRDRSPYPSACSCAEVNGSIVRKICQQIKNAHLFDNTRQGAPLEAYSCVPLSTQRCIHALLKLRMASIGMWQVFDQIFRGLLIALFRNDDMCFLEICTAGRINARKFFNEMWLWWKFLCACASPRTLAIN